MIVVAITGSVGMGKSTVAGFFAEMGAALFDADAAVHRLYQRGGKAVRPIAAQFPACVDEGKVDRDRLAKIVFANAEALAKLEDIVHPLVAGERQDFVAASARAGKAMVVAEIPLLFETGAQKQADVVVVVSAPIEVQRARVMARPGMTQDRFEAILARQMPDAQKRRLADYVILTDGTLEATRAQVAQIVADISTGV